jgi:hypothetical protein
MKLFIAMCVAVMVVLFGGQVVVEAGKSLVKKKKTSRRIGEERETN